VQAVWATSHIDVHSLLPPSGDRLRSNTLDHITIEPRDAAREYLTIFIWNPEIDEFIDTDFSITPDVFMKSTQRICRCISCVLNEQGAPYVTRIASQCDTILRRFLVVFGMILVPAVQRRVPQHYIQSR
jgi:hypothetical protein